MDPNSFNARLILASSYALKGMHGEAIALADKVLASLHSKDASSLQSLGCTYGTAGEHEKARSVLNRMLDIRTRRYVDAFLIGEVCASLGEKDKAFEWLNKAYEEHAGQMIFIKIDPWWKKWRSDPRCQEILKKTGFDK